MKKSTISIIIFIVRFFMRIKGQKNCITIIHYYGQHQLEHMVVIQWLYVGISTIQKHQVGGYLK